MTYFSKPGIVKQKKKLRLCLGFCGKMVMSTAENRICPACKEKQMYARLRIGAVVYCMARKETRKPSTVKANIH